MFKFIGALILAVIITVVVNEVKIDGKSIYEICRIWFSDTIFSNIKELFSSWIN